ncbi:MAG TPA: quinone oxidoreductase [Kofleriaceae bacterium]
MRAIEIQAYGGPEVMQLVERQVPEPTADEVRIRHAAIGINFVDVYNRTGLYPLPLPGILGGEGAGVVDAVGAHVTHLTVGDRVVYGGTKPGSYAEARTIVGSAVVKLPDAVSFEVAAAAFTKGLTVNQLLLRTFHRLERGDYVVWHAAAGGVGLIACQWAKLLGYRVIATAGSREKCDLAIAHGAEYAIDYRTEDVVARVKEITGGKRVKAVFDSVGKDTWERSLDCLQPYGLMVSYGNASGAVPPVALGQLAAKGSLYVTRPTMGTFATDAPVVQAMAAELFARLVDGSIRVTVERRYPLAQAAQAHKDLEARVTTGAGVLIP